MTILPHGTKLRIKTKHGWETYYFDQAIYVGGRQIGSQLVQTAMVLAAYERPTLTGKVVYLDPTKKGEQWEVGKWTKQTPNLPIQLKPSRASHRTSVAATLTVIAA